MAEQTKTPNLSPIATSGGILQGRVFSAAVVTIAVAASLITFPAAIPVMIAVWLTLGTTLAIRGGRCWIPLAICVAILFVKGVHWSPALMSMLVVLLLTVCLAAVRASDRLRLRRGSVVFASFAACWAVWFVFLIHEHRATHTSRHSRLDTSRPIACLGDSLTAFGFPSVLSEMVSIPVLDFGQDGITTAEGMKRLGELFASNPQAIVVELGGHDFLKGYEREQVSANLEEIIVEAHANNAQVVLMEVPRGLVRDPFCGMERALACKHDLELIPDTPIRKLVLWSPFGIPGRFLPPDRRLSDDGLHPNEGGNRTLAEYATIALVNVYGHEVLK